MRTTELAFPLFAAALLSGCAVLNTGEVDYRRASPPGPRADAVANWCLAQPKNAKPIAECPPLSTANLHLKNYSLNRPIEVTQAFSVSIDHGLITDMVEPRFAFRRAVQLKNPLHKVGEIVILAHVFEFESAVTTSTGFLDFADFSKAKVVYYHPDVQDGQDLSFSNIPILPPTIYNGRPVGIQLVILELDRLTPPMKALLEKLAAMGQATSVVAGNPVAQTLLTLGSSMITSDNDDVIFEYRFVLDPPGTTQNFPSPTLEEGRYVIRRQEERDQAAVWRNVVLDPNTGELKIAYRKDGGTQIEHSPFDQSSYLTLSIKQHPPAAASHVAMQNLEQLGQAISAAGQNRDAAFTKTTEQLTELAKAAGRSNRAQALSRSWQAVEAAGLRYAGHTLAADAAGICPTLASQAEQRQLAEVRLRSVLASFITDYLDVVTNEPMLTFAQQQSILSQVAAYTVPSADPVLSATSLADPSGFAEQLRQSPAEFSNAVVNATRVNRGMKECPA